MILNCHVCGNEFYKVFSQINKGSGRYCSRQCYAVIQRQMPGFFTGKKHTAQAKKKMSLSNIRNPRRYWLGKTKSAETIQKMRDAGRRMKGEKSNNWKGDAAGYTAIHMWICSNFEKPAYCDHCNIKKDIGIKFNWANISKEYKRDREDWYYLCRKCHHKYDDITNKGWVTRRARQGGNPL